MTTEELKKIKERVKVTFRFSKSGIKQYYSVFVQDGKIVGDVPKILAQYNKPVVLPKDLNLTELIDTIRNYSFTPKHFSIYLINGEPANLYTAKTLKKSIEDSKDKFAKIFIDFLKVELLEDLNKCNYVQIAGESLNKEASNKKELLYILNCKSYKLLKSLGLKEPTLLTEEVDPMNNTIYLDNVLCKTNLCLTWM